MFDVIKKNVDILAVAERMFDRKFVAIGDKTFAPEDRECPFCNHKDCFRVKQDGEESVFKCFSCDVGGDVTTMVSEYKKISLVEAGRVLAKEFKLKLPSDYTPVQEVFNLAAEYYLSGLQEAGPASELMGLTPLEFQEQKRGHKLETLVKNKVGWSDGKVIEYLEAFGIEKSIITESGLMNKRGSDFLPSKCFIYPHFVRGRVSHFTFKDPLKQKEFQLPNRHKLNGHSFYNSDSIVLDGPIIIVEGENDALSIQEAGWASGVICCNGSISASQLEWLGVNLAKRDVITIFDTDPAGDKYREKVQKLIKNFNSLRQVKLSTAVKDIDEYLKGGGDLTAAINTVANSPVDTDVEIEGTDGSGIIEKNGAYYKVRMKEGNEYHIKLSNFKIEMRNIYIRNGERERDIVVVREDGLKSEPIKVNSDCKVSVKPFKTLMSNAVDASFYGKEEDLTAMWEYVYTHSNERVVYLPETVGRIDEFKGWLFQDIFISDSGSRYNPDENGVIWISNNSVGLKPVSLVSNSKSKDGIAGVPFIGTDMSEEERDELLAGFIKNLGQNIGSLGDALAIVGWAWASIYVENIYKTARFFPLLYFWGRYGKGKSSIIRWVECLYNMEESGYTTFPQLNSGVSFSRKLCYYSSLPMCVDELRADREASEWYGTFRSWYDRIGKATGTREGFGVNEVPIRATVMFGGEEQFTDPATRNRCIPIKISAHGRETVETFTWIDNRRLSLSAIGYHWILNYGKISQATITKEFKELEVVLKQNNIQDRAARNWSAVSIFALRLSERYFPEFNYMDYMIKAAKVDIEKQKEDDTLVQFWEVVEGMQSMEHSKLSKDHFSRDGETLHIWFAEVFRLFESETPYSVREKFSKRAILEGLKEEVYFLKEGRAKMGVHEITRRVLTIDLTKAPETLNNIASFLG